MTARASNAIVRLDVVALGASVVVVMLVRSGQLRVECRNLCHEPSFLVSIDKGQGQTTPAALTSQASTTNGHFPEVVGVDHSPQPNYPFEFHQADVFELKWGQFDAIHASPPCQAFTAYRRKGYGVGEGYPDLIAPTRDFLQATGLPYVIENVPGAPLLEPKTLCGSMFGLDVRRHRYFESSFALSVPSCDHAAQTVKGKRFPGATNRRGRYTCEVGVWRIPLEQQQSAMGIAWMSLEELSEAIPPAYTAHVGAQLLTFLSEREVAA